MEAVSAQRRPYAGLVAALRRVLPPLLLVGLPVGWVIGSNVTAFGSGVDMGFDFHGTLWEPARAVVYGGPIYAEPTRDAVVIGNPSVYPPLFILLAIPLGLLPATAAAWVWMLILATCVGVALWIVGLRDRRLLLLAILSPVVGQGLFFGNLTLALMLPIALAWRYRERPWLGGSALAVAIAAKLFAWPLVFWLLFTRRFKAAAISVVLAIALVMVPWAAIGFEGFADYPALLRAVQEVYATISLSLSTSLAGLGVPTSLAVTLAGFAGIVLVGLAWWLSGRADGDRRAFAAVIGACIVASPIVWQNYTALLFIPIAITWPRVHPAWFFGYAVWLAALLPKPTLHGEAPCCKPPDMPEVLWIHSHADPAWGHAGGTMAVVVAVVAAAIVVRRRPRADGHPAHAA
jgi:glycosyl transferase family 87